MSCLLWIVLLWTLGCMYFFKLEFSSFLGICPGVGLLYHMVTLFLVFKRTSVLSSIVAAPIYIPTDSVGGFSGPVSIDWFFSSFCGFLFLCVPGNFWLAAKHCGFKRCWVLDNFVSYKHCEPCPGMWLSYLQRVWSFWGLLLALLSRSCSTFILFYSVAPTMRQPSSPLPHTLQTMRLIPSGQWEHTPFPACLKIFFNYGKIYNT